MEMLLHPADGETQLPDARGRLSTVGHGAAFRAFARAARKTGVRFMVIGGTFRDVAVRAASTRDIDVVLIDQVAMDPVAMKAEGFTPVSRSPHAWRYQWRDRDIDLEIAAVASSTAPAGPFSLAYADAETTKIEGVRVTVPRVEDYVILKLLAAVADRRRRARDLADVQSVLERYRDRLRGTLSVPQIRARLRDRYAITDRRLVELVTTYRSVPRPNTRA